MILNNDQQQHKKKQQQQTTGLIQILGNNIQLMSIGVIVSEKFFFQKMFVCCLQVCYAGTTILLPNSQEK